MDIYPQHNQFINIHSHHKPKGNEWALRNAYHHFTPSQIERLFYPVSVGVHPWHCREGMLINDMNKLEPLLSLPQVLAVGEVGLDRACDVHLDIQMEYWKAQFHLAQQYNKPLIIHAVRMYDEFVPYLKRSKVPFIFHRYNGNIHQTNRLLNENAYFSFGTELFNISDKRLDVFRMIPHSRLFLETDIQNTPVESVYQQASSLVSVDIIELKSIIFNNFYENF